MNAVLAYENKGFTGKVASFPVGEYKDKFALEAMGIGRDTIGSMKIPAGLKVIAYEHGDYNGFLNGISQEYTGDVADVGSLNDKIDSMKVIATGTGSTTGSGGSGSTTGNQTSSDKGKKISIVGWIAISLGAIAFLGGLTYFVIKAVKK